MFCGVVEEVHDNDFEVRGFGNGVEDLVEVVIVVAAELKGERLWRECGRERDGREVVEGDGGCGGGDSGEVLLGGRAGGGIVGVGSGGDEDGDGEGRMVGCYELP